MADPVLVHIGLAKTATTTLQQDVFSKTPAVAYLGKNLVPEALDAARRQLTRAAAERFDAEAARAAFEAYRREQSGVPVFSDEDLSVWKFLDPAAMGARIGAVFPDSRLLYVVRRPRDWVLSQYFFRLSTWRPDTMDGVNPWLEAHLDRPGLGSDVAEIRFAETFRRFHQAAGEPPFLVLAYEQLAQDAATFLAEIDRFAGLDGALRGLAPATAHDPWKARISAPLANFHRLLGSAARDRARFHDVARLIAVRAVAEDRQQFDALAADAATTSDQWRAWLGRVERRVRRALTAGDAELVDALSLDDDYDVRPDLLARIDAIELEETAAMGDRFGVDLSGWSYGRDVRAV